MGKDSEFYKDKKKKQLLRLRELIARLPGFAVDYIYSKELTTQTSTLISYSYDLITFFEFLQDRNPIYKDVKTLFNEVFSIDAKRCPQDGSIARNVPLSLPT